MLMMLIWLSFLSSFLFMIISHPLSLGLILLFQTILVTLITGLMNLNFWYSYIMFLIMIGGMLILFIYMTSVASNEKFKFSMKLFYFSLTQLFLIFPMFLSDSFYLNKLSKNWDLTNQNFNMDFSISLMKFINWPYNSIFIMMIIYLLITLIMTVKITNIEKGPLRQKF
uniref:NADH-ubiquinone oxidoreductase chain 6 n=1 Tax=Lamiinae sp. 1 ACP-2013 TaxID=1434531 RepID=A0A3G5FNI7_9CUCU|nr:NADH dehydrogenase subunit 6 [Lamiinae sp. 1 ACP-2013]